MAHFGVKSSDSRLQTQPGLYRNGQYRRRKSICSQSRRLWGHGHTMITHSNDLTINYVSGYIMKNNIKPINKWDDRQKEFSLMSKKMGLSYLTPQMIKWYRDRELTNQHHVKRKCQKKF